MNLSALFIRRPVMTTLVMSAILLFGLISYRYLPVSDLPNVDYPTIQVTASLPGASPETMASSVATPLEKQFSTIAGIDSMSSVSSLGSTRITIQFSLERDIDAAAQDGAPGDAVRHGPRAGLHKDDVEMILQILADAGKMVSYFDASLLQQLAVANAGEHQEARTLDRTGGENDLPFRADLAQSTLVPVFDADRALALEQHKLALATTSDENRSIGQARAKCFEMLARGGRLHAALRILRNDDAAQLQGASSPLIQLRFLLSLLSGLSANLPEQADLETGLRAPEMRTVGALHAWAKAEAAQLVTRFDARNENDYYARRLARALSAEPAAQPLPAESSAIPDHAHSEGQPQAASAFESDRADGIYPAGSADSSLEHAETALSQKRYLVAAEHYAKAAGLFARDGWLERAGVAYADAAQSAASAGDDETSQRGFSAAVPLLQGGGAAPELLISVIAAWAPVAASLGRETEPLTALIELLPQLDHLVDSPGGELSDELADRRRRERAATSATARDTLARLIASADPACLPAGITRERAVHEAGRAGEAFAQLGRIADAAHAFWLAGKVQRELGQTNDAVWSLESAFEGFTVVRAKQQRTDVASELIELLRQTGQPERADEIALQLFT